MSVTHGRTCTEASSRRPLRRSVDHPPSVAVCIPARDEAATVDRVVAVALAALQARNGRADEVVVVDDGSTDATAAIASAAGARVIGSSASGKGEAMRHAVWGTSADLLVFVDADLTSIEPAHIDRLLRPLVDDEQTMLVKPRYQRDLFGRPDEGGRVTELVARPLLQLYWPALAHIAQPLAGEYAVRRTALDHVALADGYAVDLSLMIDIFVTFGLEAIAETDLGVRTHRNRPLRELTPQAAAIIASALDRPHVTSKPDGVRTLEV